MDLLSCLISPPSPTPLRSEESELISEWLFHRRHASAVIIEIFLMRSKLDDLLLSSWLVVSRPPFPLQSEHIKRQIQAFSPRNLGDVPGVYVSLRVSPDSASLPLKFVIYRNSNCILASLPLPPIDWGTSTGAVGDRGFIRHPEGMAKLKVCRVRSINSRTGAVLTVTVGGVTKSCKGLYVSSQTVYHLLSDHYHRATMNDGRLDLDWEKFENWVSDASDFFCVNER